MQTADSNENLRQDFAYTIVEATDKGPEPGGGSEQNENHFNNKYQQLSWRSNGFLRNKEQLQSVADERNQSASAGNWRVLNNKDNHYQHQNTDSASEDMIFVQQDKKFSTRTFEQRCIITDEDVDNVEGDMLHAEKGVLRNSSHSIRDLSGVGRSNQRLQTSNDKSKVTHLAHLLLSEDMRISKILRRLLNENSSASAVDLCKKLDQAVRTPENVLYICRSFEYLTESMITVLKQCPVQCAEQASSILGVIGYINRADFPIYKNYISKTYQTCKGIQKYLMMALKTTFSCDAVNLNLAVYSDRVLVLLKDYLENADKAENFIAVSETIAEFSKHYKRAFQKHFTDIVDIIVGWHLEMEQPQALKLHCSTVLQQLSQYFVQELDFTFGLLGQFLEDIASFGEKAELSVGSFVGAFNSILKSLATPQEFIAFSMGRITMQQAVIIITRATKQCLSLMLCEETILNCNEFFCLIFANDFDAVDIAEIVEIVALEIKQFNNMNEQQVASLLVLMLSIIRQLRTCTPIALVTLILNSADNPLTNLKFSCNEKNFKLLLKIYHEILMLKNVPLLQEAYRHIVYDVDSCMSVLQSREFYGWKLSTAQAECILNFYLAALSALATQTSSIIGMYALNPSISELLIGHCQAANVQFWSKHGTLHSALLQLIAVHCEKNHNYRISSLLLRDSQHTPDDASLNSPTSQNFSLILKFLSEVFNESAAMAKYNLRILLHWTANLLKECLEHAFVLEEHPHFLGICKAVCTAALEDPLECAPCLQILLTYPVINRETLLCLREASVFLIDSLNPEISEMYTTIFAKLPLSISLDFSKSADTVPISQRKSQIQELAQWYTSTSHAAPLRDKYFKPFLEKVSFPKQSSSSPSDVKNALTSVTEFAQPIFARCWVALQRENAVAYQQAACSSSHLLNAWLQHETACYCVRNKLRTTVGKPQETFLRIEAIIMQYARILAMKEDLKGEVASLDGLAFVQSSARQLLGFLECLEKQIYNAAEGTAFALPPLEKPAKTFFRVNAPTCNEWFKRIRTAVDLVAIHSMEPAMVIRYSEVILKNLCKSAKYNELLMDHTIMSLVWALLHCRESDTLQGLYSWVKEKTGKRYLWIKYVAEQAAGHKEQAAEGYLYLLSEHDSRMDAYIKEFLTDQLLDCLYFTNQWSQLREVLRGTETMKRETIALSCTQNVAVLNAMEDLYFGFAQPSIAQLSNSLHELMEWKDCAEADNNAENTNFSYYKTLQRLESSCLISSIQAESSDKWRMGAPLSAGAKRALHKGLQECLQQHNTSVTLHASEHLTDFIILNHVAQKQIDGLVHGDVAAANTFECSQVMPQSTVLLKCQRWSRIFEIQSNSHQLQRNNYSMFLDVAASARREGNAKLCASELGRFFALKGLREPLVDISSKVQNKSLIVDISDAVLLRGYSELAKYLYANNSSQFQLDAINLASAYCSQLIDQMSVTPEIHYPATSAKMLLTLSEWLLQRGSTAVTSSNSPQLQHLLSHIPNITDPHLDVNIGEIIPTYDMAIGKLIQTSIHQNETAGQAWCAFGNWCYRWGKKLVEFKTDGKSTHKAGLSQRDLDQIKESLEEVDNIENVLDDIVGILNRHQVNPNDGDEDIETSEISSTELIESQLRKINALHGKPAIIFSSIIKTWRQAHKSIYTYYEMAAEAYFKYLCIETVGKGAKQGACTEDSTLVTTTLRLLRLVVKHAFGLQEVLEEGLSNTPTRPWKVIIPQLFSRLNHHEPYVRKRVSELLCRVAEDKPHLIIFPAVVGAQQELKRVQMPDFTGGKDIDSSSLRDNDERTTPLSNCFNTLLFTLSKQAPETVKQVQLLVKELKRVTLLWDEYWIHSLSQLYAEYSSLFSALEVEAKKATDLNLDSLRTKHAILMRYVIADLRKIATVSEKPAETNYERNFQERYNAFIRNTIHELEQPLNVHKTNESWQRIKHLYSVFQQRALRASASSLKMSDISPILANMRNTAISMPGVETIDRQPVYIKAVDNTVYILPTKTKPKKLAFLGSDGRKYTYLFKGFEDLHLDERIMQFLSISNSMMARSVDSVNSSNSYKAQHYSVIPLGPQSGLISWVDGVTPLFAIYKKAQQREALVKQQQKERPVNSNQVGQHSTSVPPAAVRPSELFYSKLTPLLAEQNIKVTDTRKHWPLNTLRRVLEELTRETPRDLLAKELWCHATNAADWRRSVRNYSLSVAVMSVIGYVIGLGDRHLDNVLVKLSTGEIVHIDYNVCFEKGKTLRVPEKVPFRMTPNLEEALGITGIEGTFRLGCEHVLKILRKERETLLTLLEAFVYDPLVDWAVGDDGTTTSTHMTNALAAAADISVLKLTTASGVPGDAEEGHKRLRQDHLLQRKNIDAEITRNTISLRFNELKPFWVQYKDEATFKLQEIVSHVQELEQTRQDIQRAEQERDSLTKQLAMIRELEMLGSAMGSHPLNTISQRYAVYKKSAEEFNRIKQGVKKCYDELQASAEIYFERLINTAPNTDLAQLRNQLCEHHQSACANEFELVRELLEQSAQDQLYHKSDFARREMDNTVYQQARVAMECVDSLLQYARIMRFYPRSQLARHRIVQYMQWYSDLLDEVGEGSVLDAELQRFVEDELLVDPGEQLKTLQYSSAMEKLWIELNIDLHKSVNFLGEQQQQVIVPVDAALKSIESFISIDKVKHTHALQLAMLETIAKTNESFIVFEESSLNQDEDDTFILDQQIDYIDMLLTMLHAVFVDIPPPAQSYTTIKILDACLQALYKLKSAFHVDMPERIAALFTLDDDVDLQSCLNMLCSSSDGLENYKRALSNVSNAELQDLLVEIEELFDECGIRLNNLSEIVQDILNQTPDGRVKQFVLSIYCYDFDPSNEKYETISKVFHTVRTHVASLQTNNLGLLYDVRLLNAPVVEFLNNMQQCFLTGLTSLIALALEHSLHKTLATIETSKQTDPEDASALLNAKTLCQNLFVALQQNCTLKHVQLQVHEKTKLVEHFTLVATAHFWANERYLRESKPLYGHVVHKEKLLNSVQNASQSLGVWKLTMSKIQTEIEENVTAIAQRLKWAVGANQNLNSLQESFHSCVQTQNSRYRFFMNAALQLIECSNVLLQFELMQSNHDGSTVEADRAFSATVTKWQNSLDAFRQMGSMITPVEQSIVQLLDPEGKVDQCWINNISGLLDEMTFAVQRQLVDFERTAQKIQENIYEGGQQLQSLMDNQLRMDIRHLLKSVLKVNSLSNQINLEKSNSLISARIREFQHTHKQFYAQLNDLQMKIISRDFAEHMLRQLKEQILHILQIMEDNYEDLFDLVQSFIQNDFSNSSPARSVRSAVQSQSNANTNATSSEKKAINQREQKRNAYAVSVWKRIRMKLEGRDPDPNRRCTVSEQIDFIIREATNPDNLAVLYEGWTPWV